MSTFNTYMKYEILLSYSFICQIMLHDLHVLELKRQLNILGHLAYSGDLNLLAIRGRLTAVIL